MMSPSKTVLTPLPAGWKRAPGSQPFDAQPADTAVLRGENAGLLSYHLFLTLTPLRNSLSSFWLSPDPLSSGVPLYPHPGCRPGVRRLTPWGEGGRHTGAWESRSQRRPSEPSRVAAPGRAGRAVHRSAPSRFRLPHSRCSQVGAEGSGVCGTVGREGCGGSERAGWRPRPAAASPPEQARWWLASPEISAGKHGARRARLETLAARFGGVGKTLKMRWNSASWQGVLSEKLVCCWRFTEQP